MPLKEMPGFVLTHKNVLNAVICSVISCVFLIIQLILMKRSVIAVVFDIIIPFSSAITFGCYAITMALDRPFILICPPMAYFISLLINQLFSVEWGIGETYPIFTLIEIIPVIFYCISVTLCKLQKVSIIILKIFSGLLLATVTVLVILSVFFKIALYSRVSSTFAMTTGMIAIQFIYIGMIEQLKIAGTEKKQTPHLSFFKIHK